MRKYKLKPHHPRSSNGNGHITKHGHTMLQQDIVMDLDRKEYLEKEIKTLKEELEQARERLGEEAIKKHSMKCSLCPQESGLMITFNDGYICRECRDTIGRL